MKVPSSVEGHTGERGGGGGGGLWHSLRAEKNNESRITVILYPALVLCKEKWQRSKQVRMFE